MAGLMMSAHGVGSLIYGLIFYAIVNPHNIEPI